MASNNLVPYRCTWVFDVFKNFMGSQEMTRCYLCSREKRCCCRALELVAVLGRTVEDGNVRTRWVKEHISLIAMLKIFPPKQALVYIHHTLRSISSSSISKLSSSPFESPSNLTNAILNSRTPYQALNLFNSSSKKLNPTKYLAPYAAIIHVLTNAKLYSEARCLMKYLTENLLNSRKPHRVCYALFNALNSLRSPKCTPDVFGTLIISFSEMGFIEESLWVYRKIRVLPAIQACNALLNVLVKKGRFDAMWELYEDMLSRGFVAGVVTYGVLIDGCCGEGDVLKARCLFDEMVEKGIKPTVVIYSILIRCLCNESKMMEAESIFRSMRESGVLPNLYTYNALMDGYCKQANMKEHLTCIKTC
ncbi:hypothetical protein Patl1_18795 [Pistacia atlantica]|uniref:Uncharacterized protein n=1 Tax=Pistacia atlantica TaxID=434234 RepID=A0ACC1BYQ8_9ROSI|nr:hypothetical protein Patl1_18795 [Pistacia atlantica]